MKTMVSTAGVMPGPCAVMDVLPPGAKAGPWIVERELGRGGMGAVYAVVHHEIGKRAALKVVHSRLVAPSFNPDRMVLEAKVVNQVGHPNIVDIFETGKLDDGRPYIVMERLEGQPLSYRAEQGKIAPDQVIAILLQICDALIAAHSAGIIHRDLKLDNVFLVDNLDEPGVPKVKLLDWGIAKIINHDVHHTIEGQLVGTPQYVSPEQARGATLTPQTDVYSLGVMAYELFLEALPFEAETAAEVMVMHLRASPPPPHDAWPDIPHALELLLLQMLAKKADDRPTMFEVVQRLAAVREELERRREPSQVIPATRGAETHSDWYNTTRRWQYVVGAAALAASAVMYIIGRSGDSAAAMPAPQAAELRGDLAPAHEARAQAPAAAKPVASAPPIAPETILVEIARPRAPTTRVQPAHSPATRGAPAAPRRSSNLDPNGTIDPYR